MKTISTPTPPRQRQFASNIPPGQASVNEGGRRHQKGEGKECDATGRRRERKREREREERERREPNQNGCLVWRGERRDASQLRQHSCTVDLRYVATNS